MYIFTKKFPFIIEAEEFGSHFDAFLAFAAMQPTDRKIDHQNWCHCAVGMYHKEATSIPPRGTPKKEINLQRGNSPLLEELKEDHLYIYDALSQGSVPDDDYNEHDISTYAGLAVFMETFREADRRNSRKEEDW